jgi:hypothetical protein
MSATHLEIDHIVLTAEKLAARVHTRFHGRGIADLVDELVDISRATEARVRRLGAPRRRLRAGLVALAVVAVGLVVYSATRIRYGFDIDGTEEWLDVLANAIQDLVFLGIAVLFLVGVEGRLKRRDALAGLHDLRSLAHVIDMHQLTKDPDSARHPGQRSPTSPDRPDDLFLLGRYLDYCSEMLSITSKLAALYAQESQDPVVLAAVGGIQDLTGGLSNKVWQKLVILDTGSGRTP